MNKSPTPKYFQVQQVVRGRIASGEYPVGSQLPTEDALALEFQVSRQSIRTALQALANDGIIVRTAGRGTFVTEPRKLDGNWTIRSLEDVIAIPFNDSRQVIGAGMVSALDHPAAARELELGPGRELLLVRTRRLISAGPYAFARIYVPGQLSEALEPHEFSIKPMIQLIEDKCRLRAARARQLASAVAADAEVAATLGTAVGTPTLLLRRTYFTADNWPVEYAENYYHSDRYSQVTDLFRTRDDE